MSVNKTDISLIRKYLNGELDARAMHELERRAQADPFLWDMMQGMERGTPSDQSVLDEIDALIDKRVEKDKKRVVTMWRIASIAASLLIVLGFGIWFFAHQPENVAPALTVVKKPAPVNQDKITPPAPVAKPSLPLNKQPTIAKLNHKKQVTTSQADKEKSPALAAVTYKSSTDTVEYKASDYKVRQNATAEEMLKKLPGYEVGADGNVTHQGQAVTKVRLNAKEYNSGLITGTVVDKNNSPMANAIVTQNGTSNRAITDANGNFSIGVPLKSDLTVNSLGYVPKLVKVNDKNRLKITMSDSLKSLAEVNVLGYGTSKKTTLTGAVSNVEAKDLKEVQATSVDQALQGRLPGVDIQKAKTENSSKTITGRVIAKEDHEPIPGATIKVKGSNTGTVTDANGKFKLTLPAKADALIVAFIGYDVREIKVPSKNETDIELSSSSKALAEVVIARTDDYASDKPEDTDARPYIGWEEYNKYIKNNATTTDDKKGVVRLAFTVNADGSISNITVKKSISPATDQKAIELVKNGPKFRGNKNRKPETVRLRVRFK